MKMNGKRVLPAARLLALTMGSLTLGAVTMHAQDAPPPPMNQTQGDMQGPPQGGPGRGGMGGERQIQMMTKQLNLTPDQVTKLKALEADDRQQMMALHNDSSLSQDDMRAKMMTMRKDREVKIKSMLTDDQKVKYDEMQAKMRERRMEHGNGDAPPPPPPSQM